MRIVVGITGATGAYMGFRLLQMLNELGHETYVVISRWGMTTLELECGKTYADLEQYATAVFENDDLGAPISSGSFSVDGMIIIPCSMKTLSAVANGYTENLVIRAADVSLKERRKLVVVARETPLNSIHLRNMLALSDMGAVIMPPLYGYYSGYKTLDEMTDAFLGRVMMQFGISNHFYKAWGAE